MLGAESKLHAIFSADFISLHQRLLGKKLWTKLIGPFFIRGPSLNSSKRKRAGMYQNSLLITTKWRICIIFAISSNLLHIQQIKIPPPLPIKQVMKRFSCQEDNKKIQIIWSYNWAFEKMNGRADLVLGPFLTRECRSLRRSHSLFGWITALNHAAKQPNRVEFS